MAKTLSPDNARACTVPWCFMPAQHQHAGNFYCGIHCVDPVCVQDNARVNVSQTFQTFETPFAVYRYEHGTILSQQGYDDVSESAEAVRVAMNAPEGNLIVLYARQQTQICVTDYNRMPDGSWLLHGWFIELEPEQSEEDYPNKGPFFGNSFGGLGNGNVGE